MRVNYITEKTVKAGDFMRVHIFPTRREAPKGGGRRARFKPTCEAQRRYNAKCAERELEDLLHANFTQEDSWVRLSYGREYDGMSVEDAERHVRNFIRRLRRYKCERGQGELKYVHVTEPGDMHGRIHHHVFFNGKLSARELLELWGHGYVNRRDIVYTEEGLHGLAHYNIKHPSTAKRWYASRNLKRPEVSTNNTRLSFKQAKAIYDNLSDLASLKELYPGYRAVSIEATEPNLFGGELFTVINLVRDNVDFFKPKGSGGRKLRRLKGGDAVV